MLSPVAGPGNKTSLDLVYREQTRPLLALGYATSMAQLDDAFHKISDELRTQYLLAYYPSQRLSNSQFRRIQVGVSGVLDGSSYRVRHRAGYYTSKSDF